MPQIKPQIALLAIAIVAALIIIGVVQQQQQQPKVIVIKPNATPTATAAPPPASAPQQAPIFACNNGALYKDNNVTVCGVLYVDQQYVYAKSGWVSGGPIVFGSDVSSCVFQLQGQMLQFNCQQVIAIRR